jgi:type II secretory pathway pseudopilin PulG
MLVLLTLVAVSAINSTTTSVQMVGNAQFREEATAAAQKAIENVISTGDFRSTPPAPQTIKVNGVADYTVTFEPAPSCVSFKPVDPTDPATPPECASSIGAVCFWTVWDIRAVVKDPVTGASVAVHQGIRTVAGLNAGVAACGV